MRRAIEFTGSARRDLRRLDRAVAARILSALERFAETGEGDITRLHGTSDELRLRVGDWRVRFDYIDGSTIRVLRVLPRGRAYER